MDDRTNLLVVANNISVSQLPALKNALANTNKKVHLVYVVPEIPAQYFMMSSAIDLRHQLLSTAETHMAVLAKALGISAQQQWIRMGRLRLEVARLNNELLNCSTIWHCDQHQHQVLLPCVHFAQRFIGSWKWLNEVSDRWETEDMRMIS